MPKARTEDDGFETRVARVARAVLDRGGIDAGPDEVEAAARVVLGDLRDAPVQDFVVVLAERMVRERLGARRRSPQV